MINKLYLLCVIFNGWPDLTLKTCLVLPILLSTLMSSKLSVSSDFPTKYYTYFPSPPYLTVPIMKLLILHLSTVYPLPPPSSPTYLPWHTILAHPRPMLLPSRKDQVPHPYKTTGKIIALFVLKDRLFWNTLPEFCLFRAKVELSHLGSLVYPAIFT